MVKYKLGDYIVSKDKQMYRIISIGFSDPFCLVPHYGIRGLTKKVNYFGKLAYEDIRGLTEQEIENIGTIIPEESAAEMFKILYQQKE